MSRPNPLCFSLAALIGCPGTEAIPSGRSRLLLDQGWSSLPWRQAPKELAAIDIHTTVTLPPERRAEAADLLLEGLWWRATLTVDGEAMPVVTGGAAPVRIPLGDHLADGEAHIELHITGPEQSDPPALTGGELIRNQRSRQHDWPWLSAAPVLELHPKQELRFTTLRAETGGAVTPIAWVSGGFVGQQVRFRATRDGVVLQELGSAALSAKGEARGEALQWRGPRWSPAQPELILFEATLLDSSGSVLDQRADRTGLRHLSSLDSSLFIDEVPLRIHAIRVGYEAMPKPLPFYLLPYLDGGINAVELHGDLVPESWMEQADELGLPVSRVPRCAGLAGQKGALPAARLPELEAQDQRFVEAHLHRPSLVMWMDEYAPGSAQVKSARLSSTILDGDPQPRASVPRDRAELAYDGRADLNPCEGRSCQGVYVSEVHPDLGVSWAAVAGVWKATLDAGIWGGVVPRPPNGDIPKWTAAFSSELGKAGVPPWPPGERRASSALQIRGLKAGETVWLNIPGQPAIGSVADPDGTATLQAWYEGPATLSWALQRRAVTLKARRWSDMSLVGDAQQVSVTAR